MAAEKEQPKTRDWWPAEDIKAYAEWLYLERSGFQSLRFVLSKKEAEQRADIAVDLAEARQDTNIKRSFERSSNRQFDENVSVDSEDEDVDVEVHGISEGNFDALFDVTDRVGHVGDTSGRVRYNNPLLDTNWIAGADLRRSPLSPSSSSALLLNTDTATKTSRYAGNVISLCERLRNIADLKRANGDQRSGAANFSASCEAILGNE